jgi:outer membrane protein assembly factor BamB
MVGWSNRITIIGLVASVIGLVGCLFVARMLRRSPFCRPGLMIDLFFLACWSVGTSLILYFVCEIRDSLVAGIVAGYFLASLVLPLLAWYPLRERTPFYRSLLGFSIVSSLLFWAFVHAPGINGDEAIVLTTSRELPGTAQPLAPSTIAATPAGQLSQTSTQPYPQFRGVDRRGTLPGIRLDSDWDRSPPRLRWKQAVGGGLGGVSVQDGIIVTQEQRGPDEVVVALDLASGQERWSHRDPARFETNAGGTGPRSTPTIHNGRVYAIGATGVFNCLDFATGERIWSRNAVHDATGSVPLHGLAASPLVVDDVVVIVPSGSSTILIAYDLSTGEVRWRARDKKGTYSSPTLTTIHGLRQIVVLGAEGLLAFDTKGQFLWQFDSADEIYNISQPILDRAQDGRIVLSTDKGAALLKVDRNGDQWNVQSLWKHNGLRTRFSSPLLIDGMIFGLDNGILECVDWETGERLWKGGRYRRGQIMSVGNDLLVFSELGELVLIQPSREKLIEKARLPILDGQTWNPPAFPSPLLVVRNTHEIACYQMPVVDADGTSPPPNAEPPTIADHPVAPASSADHWTLHVQGTAHASIVEATSPPENPEPPAQVPPTAPPRTSSTPADRRLDLPGPPLRRGATYTLQLRLRSPTTRSISFAVVETNPPVGLPLEVRRTVDVGQEWLNIAVDFQADRDADNLELRLEIPSDDHSVEIADLLLTETVGIENSPDDPAASAPSAAMEPALEPSRLAQPPAAADRDPDLYPPRSWTLLPTAAWRLDTTAGATAQLSPSSDADGIRIIPHQLPTQSLQTISLTHDSVSFAANAECAVRLRLRSDSPRNVELKLVSAQSPDPIITKRVDVAPTWRETTFAFTPTVSDASARWNLLLGDSPTPVEMALFEWSNQRLETVSVAEPVPTLPSNPNANPPQEQR